MATKNIYPQPVNQGNLGSGAWGMPPAQYLDGGLGSIMDPYQSAIPKGAHPYPFTGNQTQGQIGSGTFMPAAPSDGFTGTAMDWGKPVEAAKPANDWSSGYGFTGTGGFTGNDLQTPKGDWSAFMDSMMGTTNKDGIKSEGWGGLALNAVSGIGSAWMGNEKLKLARDTLDQQKKEFDMNWGAQRSTTNASLEDRQRARIASNSGAYQSVGDYMNKYGIK